MWESGDIIHFSFRCDLGPNSFTEQPLDSSSLLYLPQAVYNIEHNSYNTGQSIRSPAEQTRQETLLKTTSLLGLASKPSRAAEPRLYIRKGSDKSKHLTQLALVGQTYIILPNLFLEDCLGGSSGSKRNIQTKAKDFHINTVVANMCLFSIIIWNFVSWPICKPHDSE